MYKRQVLTVAKNAVDKANGYAFRDRRNKKRAFRRLWIARINAASRMEGVSYSRLMHMLKEKNVDLNRKVLADMAMNHADAFKAIVNSVR